MKIRIKKKTLRLIFLIALLIIMVYLLCKTVKPSVNDKFTIQSQSTNNNKVNLIFIYADWCPHCKNVIPHINRLTDKYSNNNNVIIDMVNGEEESNKNTLKKYNVKGYPTILLLKNDTIINKKCPREYKKLKKLIDSHL